MSRQTSVLDYVVRNWPTHGDSLLEEMRKEALVELDRLCGQARGGQDETRKAPRTQPASFGLATGELYRSVMIYTLPLGKVIIFGEAGQEYEFLGQAEARSFVDANLELAGRLIGALA